MKTKKELRDIGHGLGMGEIRFLVDNYYRIQKDRKRSASQLNALGESEQIEGLEWIYNHSRDSEDAIRTLLDIWTENDPLSQWARSNVGIGPVLAAGFRAFINLDKCPTAGHIWVYAGLDPSRVWLSREQAATWVAEATKDQRRFTRVEAMEALFKYGMKLERVNMLMAKFVAEDADSVSRDTLVSMLCIRPWNARLKTICWNAGECFMKFSGHQDCYYGHIYLERKAYEISQNENGAYAEQAALQMKRFKFGRETAAYQAYSQGRLPAAHIRERAKRYAVKLFLSHYHDVGFRLILKKDPPLPYPIAHLGHVHFRPVPNWPNYD